MGCAARCAGTEHQARKVKAVSWVTMQQVSRGEAALRAAALIPDRVTTWALTPVPGLGQSPRHLGGHQRAPALLRCGDGDGPKVPPVAAARLVERLRHHLYRLNQRLLPAPAAMMEMIVATWLSQAITVAAEFGVADALATGPTTIDELASAVGVDSRRPAPAAAGIDRTGSVPSSPRWPLRAEFPCPNAMFRCRGVDVGGGPVLRIARATRALDHAGRLDPDRTVGGADAARQGGFRLFRRGSRSTPTSSTGPWPAFRLTDASVAAGYDFGAYPTIVDVGGGHGLLLAAILAATPGIRGVLYDLPTVVSPGSNILCSNGLADRVHIETGSFFDSVPAGGDVYVLKNILHDWPDEQGGADTAQRSRCRRPARHRPAGGVGDSRTRS